MATSPKNKNPLTKLTFDSVETFLFLLSPMPRSRHIIISSWVATPGHASKAHHIAYVQSVGNNNKNVLSLKA
jgi:hypothetical protein